MKTFATFSIGQDSIFFALSWMVTITLHTGNFLRVSIDNGSELQTWSCRLQRIP
jgi:hypothetical protein